MKKSVLLFLCLIVGFASVARADRATERRKLISRVETCEAILQEFMGRPETAIPPAVWARARAVVIVNQLKAGFLFGVQDGWGVMMVKRADGTWSIPVLVSAAEASLGLQVGVNTVEKIYIITDDATPKLMFKSRFEVGVDARAVAGPHVAEKQKDSKAYLNTPVLVYTKKLGLYAGATVKTGYISRDDSDNQLLYNTQYEMPELLYSNWVQPIPQVLPLMRMVQAYAP
ncbi:hypothetical protein GALL_127050 [mine drainage metagenome]|uniref:Ysc84 actin-binding domain-containing protein n=1 Tax=mine drainage metagenome TaxID=410659 RepID=A0A1J5SB10_9ZZZZ